MEKIDLSQKACDERLFLALMDVTINTEAWAQDTWACDKRFFTNLSELESATQKINEQLQKGVKHPCGTVACLAGNAAMAAGLVEARPDRWGEMVSFHIKEEAGEALGMNYPTSSWSEVGVALFGLDYSDAVTLFDGENTLNNLWNYAKQFNNGRVKLPKALKDRVKRIDRDREWGL